MKNNQEVQIHNDKILASKGLKYENGVIITNQQGQYINKKIEERIYPSLNTIHNNERQDIILELINKFNQNK